MPLIMSLNFRMAKVCPTLSRAGIPAHGLGVSPPSETFTSFIFSGRHHDAGEISMAAITLFYLPCLLPGAMSPLRLYPWLPNPLGDNAEQASLSILEGLP